MPRFFTRGVLRGVWIALGVMLVAACMAACSAPVPVPPVPTATQTFKGSNLEFDDVIAWVNSSERKQLMDSMQADYSQLLHHLKDNPPSGTTSTVTPLDPHLYCDAVRYTYHAGTSSGFIVYCKSATSDTPDGNISGSFLNEDGSGFDYVLVSGKDPIGTVTITGAHGRSVQQTCYGRGCTASAKACSDTEKQAATVLHDHVRKVVKG